jgi:hypothetical protein
MKEAIRSACALFFLGASFAIAQSTTTTTHQNTDQQSPPTAATTVTTVNATANATTSMSGDPATEASIQKMEDELAQADKAHDTTPFAKYIDDNIIAFGPGWRAMGKAEVMQSVKTNPCTMSSVALSDFTYKWISPDTVLITYVSKQNGTCQGKPMPATEYDSSLWQRKGGVWLAVFHQGTAVEPAAAS